MIPPQAISMLWRVGHLQQASGIKTELEELQREGDRLISISSRFLGAGTIAVVAGFAAIVTEHAWLWQAALFVGTIAYIARGRFHYRFETSFRRVMYLRGYMEGELGMPVQPTR